MIRDAITCDRPGCLAIYLEPTPGPDADTRADDDLDFEQLVDIAGWVRDDSGHTCPACTAGRGPVLERGECPACTGRMVNTTAGDRCLSCETTITYPDETGERCPAAHHDDPTECDGPNAVTVLDQIGAGAEACEWHGARLLASLEGGRVYALPNAPEGAAGRVFKAAGNLRPFEWYRQG